MASPPSVHAASAGKTSSAALAQREECPLCGIGLASGAAAHGRGAREHCAFVASITLNGIRKSFGDTEVLRTLDLEIRDGEFLTLVGPSGCGKSTLLRIIAGLETQSAGDVLIGGRIVNDVRPSRRDLAMVFQSYALYPHLTVAENMLTPLKLRDLGFAERLPILGPLMARSKYRTLYAQVREAADTLRIGDLLDRKPGQLSGGQRQRAALGRAMVRKPVAFLMDEPLSNLDAALRVHMRSELAELHLALATTFIYVTHDQAEALTMSDRMAVMMGGEILQLDSPEVMYADPRDRRVAEFIGTPSINILPGEVDTHGHISVLGVPIVGQLVDSARQVSVGLRPEHLEMSATGAPNAGFPFRVTHRENLGADMYLYGSVNDTEHRLIVRTTPAEAHDLPIGAEALLVARPGAALIFGTDDRRLRMRDEAHPG